MKAWVFYLFLAASTTGLARECVRLLELTVIDRPQVIREAMRRGSDAPRGVSVVTPLYRELDNGNLARLLDSFSAQSAHASTFDLVFVVNNKPEISAKKDHPAYVENQRTLALLRWLETPGALPPPELAQLPVTQREAFKRAKERGLRVVVVDRSTSGFPTNMGLLRGEGVKKALGRHPGDGKRIVAWMDGDTAVAPDYVETLGVAFEVNGLDAAFVPYRVEVDPGAGPDHYASTFADRQRLYQVRYFDAMSAAAGGRVIAEGPQIVVTAAALERLGGTPTNPVNEDFELSERIAKNAKYQHLKGATATTLDRQRPESYNGGTHVGSASDPLQLDPYRFGRIPVAQAFLARALERLEHEVLKRPLTKKEIQGAVELCGFEWNEARWDETESYLHGPYGRRGRNAAGTATVYVAEKEVRRKTSMPEQFFAMMALRVGPTERRRLRSRFDQGMTKRQKAVDAAAEKLQQDVERLYRGAEPLDPAQEFLRGNTWLGARLQEARTAQKPWPTVLQELRRDFPDWFGPFRESPTRQYNEELLEMIDIFAELKNNPTAYPESVDYLKDLQKNVGAITRP